MARNGSGVQSSPGASYPAVASTLIESAKFNAVIDDINSVLTLSLSADGQTTVTGDQNMNTHKHTNLLSGTARTDNTALGQLQDAVVNWVAAGGTVDAITATYSPAITALIDGQICCVRSAGANTSATPTFSPNGLTARTIVKNGGGALVAGNIGAIGHEFMLRYNLANTRWELLNSASNNNLTGGVTSVGNAATVVTNANLTGHVTSVGNAAVLGSFTKAQLDTAISDGNAVYVNDTPALVGTNFTGTAASLTVGAATTATNLSGGTVAATTITGSSVASTGAIISSSASAGIGYATGAGGSVTQVTSITTAVTLNTMSGTITCVSNTYSSGTNYGFVLNNSNIALGDVVIVSENNETGSGAITIPFVAYSASGIATISQYAVASGTAIKKINFAIIKAVIN